MGDDVKFCQVVDILGGAAKVSRILGLSDKQAKDVRRAANNDTPRPKWIPILKDYARNQIKELEEWTK